MKIRNILAKHAISTGFLFLLSMSSLFAESLEIQEAELVGPLQESHDLEINVSGNVIVGLMGPYAHQGIRSNQLLLQAGIFDGKRNACLRVTSRDGTYHSLGTFAMFGKAAIPTRVPYPSKYPTVLEQFESNDVGITITLDSCEAHSRQYLMPVAAKDLLNTDASKYRAFPDSMLILVNGFDATDVYFSVSIDSYHEEKDCTYIEDGRHTAFNYFCELSDLPDSNANVDVTLFREVYGRPLPDINFTISTIK